MKHQITILIGLISLSALNTTTANPESLATLEEACVLEQYQRAQGSMTIDDLRTLCAPENIPIAGAANSEQIKVKPTTLKQAISETATLAAEGPISSRFIQERQTQFSPFVITPHNMNYILPALTSSGINTGAYSAFEGFEENLEDIESKFQLSFKVPLNENRLLVDGDGLYFGFTLEAFWQIYADNISKPFRETNYQPELFYVAPTSWQPFGGNTGFVLGVEHQSNGRTQALSRSWNRVYASLLFEKGNFAMSFRPWLRIKEDPKEFEFSSDGDDNPDIEDFMGNFELGMVYKWDDYVLNINGRRNFGTHKGFIEAGLTFPLWGKLRGYVMANSGYGDSLIDYNYKQTRFGIGIALNDLL